MNEHAETFLQKAITEREARANVQASLELAEAQEGFHYPTAFELTHIEKEYLEEARDILKDYHYQTGDMPSEEQLAQFVDQKKTLLVDGIVEKGFKHSDTIIDIVNIALRGGTVELDSPDMNWRISQRLFASIENEKRARQADQFYNGLQNLFLDLAFDDDVDLDRTKVEVQRFAWDIATILSEYPERRERTEVQLSELAYTFCLGREAAEKIILYTRQNLSLLTNLLP